MTDQHPPDANLHDRAANLIEAYSLDALEPDEAGIVAAHLQEGCEDCEGQLSRFRAVVERIPLALPLREAGASLKRRVLAEVQADVDVREPRRLPTPAVPVSVEGGRPGRLATLLAPWRPARFASMAASVAVIAVVGLVGWNVVLQSDLSNLDDENDGLLATVALVEENQRSAQQALSSAQADADAATALSQELAARMTAVVSVMGTSEPQRLALAATPDAPSGAQGSLLVNPSDGTFVILARGLDGTVEGGYILWVHTSDGILPLSFFYVDAFGNGVGHGMLSSDVGDSVLSVSHEYDGTVSRPTEPAKLERLNR